jgi:hypothetical protein
MRLQISLFELLVLVVPRPALGASAVTCKQRVREFLAQGRNDGPARLARDVRPPNQRVAASPQLVARKADKRRGPRVTLAALIR